MRTTCESKKPLDWNRAQIWLAISDGSGTTMTIRMFRTSVETPKPQISSKTTGKRIPSAMLSGSRMSCRNSFWVRMKILRKLIINSEGRRLAVRGRLGRKLRG